MTDPDLIIETDQLTKRFGPVTAVSDLNIAVPRGSVYGFLGPNGAGKSTTIDILVDLVRPTSGTARVLGYNTRSSPVEIRRRTGVLLEGFSPYPTLSGREHVSFAASTKAAEIDPTIALERVDLRGAMDRPAGGYSRGMTRRLGLAMALVGEPDLLVLDEPTAGLDPNGVMLLRRILREETDRGVTVFFSSHVLPQVEAVCDRVGILADGRLVAEDDVEALRETVADETTLRARVRTDDSLTAMCDRVGAIDGVYEVHHRGGELVAVCESEAVSARVLSAIDQSGATVSSFETDGRSLERIFESYAGEV